MNDRKFLQLALTQSEVRTRVLRTSVQFPQCKAPGWKLRLLAFGVCWGGGVLFHSLTPSVAAPFGESAQLYQSHSSGNCICA